MRRILWGAALVLVCAFVAGLGLPAPLRAGAMDPGEKAKIVELLKLQLVLVKGEHGEFHGVLEKLMRKYPNDPDVKALSDEYHATMHKRMTAQEQTVDLLMQPHFFGGE